MEVGNRLTETIRRSEYGNRRRRACAVGQVAIADYLAIHRGFRLPVICDLYILFFALNGSKPNRERRIFT